MVSVGVIAAPAALTAVDGVQSGTFGVDSSVASIKHDEVNILGGVVSTVTASTGIEGASPMIVTAKMTTVIMDSARSCELAPDPALKALTGARVASGSRVVLTTPAFTCLTVLVVANGSDQLHRRGSVWRSGAWDSRIGQCYDAIVHTGAHDL